MLSLLVFLPLIGAIIILSLRPENTVAIKWIAFGVALQTFLLSLTLLQGIGAATAADPFFLTEDRWWLPALGVRYHLGVDGLSFLMVALTGLLTAIAILASFSSITANEKLFYAFILMLQTGINGTFLALDLVIFYIFWEIMLIPLYFLIGMFGSKNRIYATVKFFLFTFAGSVLMLVAILYVATMAGTSDLPAILQQIEEGRITFSDGESIALFLGFFLAFAIKVPLFPFHTWLPDAHTEAPTAGSVLLAGVLLKTGVYGLIRFAIPLFPEAALYLQWVVVSLAAIAIVYGALTAMAQTDMKRLVAYSSVSHMGFIMLGLFAFNAWGVEGAMLQLLNHGISTGGLFLCVGFLYDRRHTREMSQFGGLAGGMKVYAALTMIMVLSSVGLPLLNGFVGEFWILAGAFQFQPLFGAIGALGVILGAVYLLTMYQRVFFGPVTKPENEGLPDLTDREIYALLPLVVLVFWIGVFSPTFTNILKPSAASMVDVLENPWDRPDPTFGVDDAAPARRAFADPELAAAMPAAPGGGTAGADAVAEAGGAVGGAAGGATSGEAGGAAPPASSPDRG